MPRPKKVIKAKEPVRIRFKELQNGNKSIYLDIYRNGKRTYEFLKLYIVPEIDPVSRAMNQHNMALANKIKADRIIELTNSEKGVSNATLRGRIKLSELLDLYARWLEDNGKKSSLRGVNSIRKATFQFRGDVPIRMLDKDYCMAFMNFLRNDYKARTNRPISMTTATGYVTVLSAMLNWAVRNDYLSENPFTHIAAADRIHRPESKREFLQIDELKKLIATECPTRPAVKQAFLFSCYCALRISDVVGLTWGDIHKDGDQWRVFTVMEKTNDPIYLPLSQQAMKWLPERGDAKDEDKVFDLPSESRICIILDKWAKAAGITKHVTYHVSRHSFATMMLTLDVDIYTTSKLLGHKNIATTQIYAKIIDQKKDEAVNRVNDIFKD